MISFSAVEKPGFRQLMQQLQPKYQVPSRTYFKQKIIPAIYNDVEATVKGILGTADKLSFTTDMWTLINMEPYMSLTVHFIEQDWKLKSINLGAIPFNDDHTGVNMAEEIKVTLQKWNLKLDDVISGTTDNASNNSTMFTALEKQQLSCFGHNLDLAVNEGLKIDTVSRAVRLVRVAVDTFTRSWKKSRDLNIKQKELNFPEHKLIHDVATRWGSTANMIHRFLEQQQPVNSVLFTDRKHWHVMPDTAIIRCLEQTDNVLFPLSKLTDTFSGDQYVTVSALVPVLEYLRGTLLKIKEGDDSSLEINLKKTILKSIQKRYESEKIKLFLSICTYLDPRFKSSYVSDEMVVKVKDHLLSILDEEIQVQEIIDVEEKMNEESDKVGLSNSNSNVCGSLTIILLQIEKKKKIQKTELTDREKLKRELHLYEDNENISSTEDPLAWWKKNEFTYQKLSKFAKRYLSVPATSCASERLFSGAGLIATKTRNRLHPDTVNRMLFLSKNIDL
ncbi:hypothetical protein SNE40_014559 [Patella caerulea]